MLYILYGDDALSRREALQDLKAELDSDGMLSTNTVSLAAAQTTPQEVIAACDTAPFLGRCRLVIVEGLFSSAAQGGRRTARAGSKGAPGAGPWQSLCEYVDRMPETTVLVLVDGAVAPAHPLLEALRPRARVSAFPLPEPRAVPAWIAARARKMGLRLEPRAASLLADLVGNDTWALANEMEKLAAFSNGQPVREADVRSLVPAASELTIWDLLDAIVEARPAPVVRLLHDLLARGQNPSALLKAIETRYRRLAVAREMLDAGATASHIGSQLGTRGYALERLLDQASRQPLPAIRAALARIVEADAAVKSGLYDEEVSLEILTQDLAQAATAKFR
jgi:DNA polymerase-3 subunit delta